MSYYVQDRLLLRQNAAQGASVVADELGHVRMTANGATAALAVNQVGVGNLLTLEDGGVPRLVVLDGGNVGMGVTTPVYRLDVSGTVQAVTTSTSSGVIVNRADVHTIVGTTAGVSNFGSIQVKAGGSATAVGASNYPLMLQPDGSNIYTGSGSVGISTITPSKKLHVFGNSHLGVRPITANNDASRTLYITPPTAAGTEAEIQLETTGTTRSYLLHTDTVTSLGTTATTALHLQTANTDRLTILSGGNVGIGQSVPTFKLHIVCNNNDGIQVGGADTNLGLRLLRGTGDGATTTVYNGILESSFGLAFRSSVDSVVRHLYNVRTGQVYHEGSMGIGTTAPTAKLHVVQTAAADALRIDDELNDATPFIIKEDGKVGIGTPTPLTKLHVTEPVTIGTEAAFQNGTTTITGLGVLYNTVVTNGAVGIQIGRTVATRDSFFLSHIHTGVGAASNYLSITASGVATGWNLTAAGDVGLGITNPAARLHITATGKKLQFTNDATTNRHIVLFEDANNEHQFYGVGINAGTLRFQISGTTGFYRFFVATSATTSNEVGSLSGTGALTAASHITTTTGEYRSGALTIVDASRNLLNIGTISSGAITSSATISGTTLTASTAFNTGVGAVYQVQGATIIDAARNLTNVGTISWSANSDDASIRFVSANDNNSYLEIGTGDNGNEPIVFVQRDTALGTLERMRIHSNGFVGIGTNAPTERLSVAGNITATGSMSVASINSAGGLSGTTITASTAFNTAGTAVYQVQGTTVLDSGRNLSNIATSRLIGQSVIGAGNGLARSTQGLTVSTNVATVFAAQDQGDGNRGLVIVNENATSGTFASMTFRTGPNTAIDNYMDMRYISTGTGASSRLAFMMNAASTEHFTFTSGGNLGIGTPTPSTRLEIQGPSGELFRMTDGTRTIYGGCDINHPFFGTLTAHDLRVTTGGTERMRITTGGNLGIGTSTPSRKLQVFGNSHLGARAIVNIDDSYRTLYLSPPSAAGVGTEIQFEGAGAARSYVFHTDTEFELGTLSTNGLSLATAGTKRVRMDAVGNVRVGTHTLATFTRTLGNILNAGIDICTVAATHGAFLIVLDVVQSEGSNSVAKSYRIPVEFDATLNTWRRVLSHCQTGPYVGNDFDVDILVSSLTARLRLVRTGVGTNVSGANITCSVRVSDSLVNGATIAGATTTYAGATNNGIYVFTQLYASRTGEVGIGTTVTTNVKLAVAGSMRITGADLLIDDAGRRGGATAGVRRALVHDVGDVLTINFAGDYTGGVLVSSRIVVDGSVGCGAVTCTTINTQNNAINAGTGSISGGAITGTSLNAGAGTISTTGAINGGTVSAATFTASTAYNTGAAGVYQVQGTPVITAARGVSCTSLSTNNGNITAGTGSISGGAITGTSLSAGAGTISTTGAINGGAITGTSLNAGAGTISTTGAISGGAITGTSLSAGAGTISTTGAINGGTVSAATFTASTAYNTGAAGVYQVQGTPVITAARGVSCTSLSTNNGNITAGTGSISGGAITGTSLSAGAGTISTTGAINGGAITGTSLSAGAGTISTTGAINGGAITGTSLSAGTGTISTTGGISGGSVTGLTVSSTNVLYGGTLYIGGNLAVVSQGAWVSWNRDGGGGATYWMNQRGGGGGGHVWGEATTGNVLTEYMRLTGGGNLGIGTAAPGERLTVAGNVSATGGYSGASYTAGGNFNTTAGGYQINGTTVIESNRNLSSIGSITCTSLNASGGLITGGPLTVAGITSSGPDFVLDNGARRIAGGGVARRALVHASGDVLVINFTGDYPGGTTVQSSLGVTGALSAASFSSGTITINDAGSNHLVFGGSRPGLRTNFEDIEILLDTDNSGGGESFTIRRDSNTFGAGGTVMFTVGSTGNVAVPGTYNGAALSVTGGITGGALSCTTLTTNGNAITSGSISCTSINTNGNTITSGSVTTGSVSCTTITTNGNQITCGPINSGAITTNGNTIASGTLTVTDPNRNHIIFNGSAPGLRTNQEDFEILLDADNNGVGESFTIRRDSGTVGTGGTVMFTVGSGGNVTVPGTYNGAAVSVTGSITSGAISCTTITTNGNTITCGPINSGAITANGSLFVDTTFDMGGGDFPRLFSLKGDLPDTPGILGKLNFPTARYAVKVQVSTIRNAAGTETAQTEEYFLSWNGVGTPNLSQTVATSQNAGGAGLNFRWVYNPTTFQFTLEASRNNNIGNWTIRYVIQGQTGVNANPVFVADTTPLVTGFIELVPRFRVGDGNTAQFNSIVAPATDNTRSLGTAALRWSTVFAATGAINTSDAREKFAIRESDLGLDFVRTLRPVSYRFCRAENEMKNEVVGYHDVEVIEDDGEVRTVQEPIYQEKLVARQGKRTHYGFVAQEVREAVAAAKGNDDFAGWILEEPSNPDSGQGLRYEELLAPLTKAVQELTAMVEKCTTRIDVLEQRLSKYESV